MPDTNPSTEGLARAVDPHSPMHWEVMEPNGAHTLMWVARCPDRNGLWLQVQMRLNESSKLSRYVHGVIRTPQVFVPDHAQPVSWPEFWRNYEAVIESMKTIQVTDWLFAEGGTVAPSPN